jgi:hypothetical protein
MLGQQSLDSMAHQIMGDYCGEGGNMKMAKIHYEAAAMAGQESALFNLGVIERVWKHGTSFEALENFCIGRGL